MTEKLRIPRSDLMAQYAVAQKLWTDYSCNGHSRWQTAEYRPQPNPYLAALAKHSPQNDIIDLSTLIKSYPWFDVPFTRTINGAALALPMSRIVTELLSDLQIAEELGVLAVISEDELQQRATSLLQYVQKGQHAHNEQAKFIYKLTSPHSEWNAGLQAFAPQRWPYVLSQLSTADYLQNNAH